MVVILIQSLAFASMHSYDLLGNFGIMITGTLVAAVVAYLLCKKFGYLKEK